MLKIVQSVKNFLLLVPFSLILYPFRKFFLFSSYLTELNIWILKNKKDLIIKSPLKLTRNYALRYDLYNQVKNYYQLEQSKVSYLEFGVASGSSFKWWLAQNKNEQSFFAGFDTFEGLPEDWGMHFKKGAMSSAIPEISDKRGQFFKGLFQNTLPGFIERNSEQIKNAEIRIIHCDADLYSATIFVLSQLYPLLKKGDIILFDEFNVPMHEFKAFKEFTENFYIRLKPIAQVNTFYQVAFLVEEINIA